MYNSLFHNNISNKVNILCQKIKLLSNQINVINNKSSVSYEEFFYSTSWSTTPASTAENLEANIIKINNLVQFSMVSLVGGNGDNTPNEFIIQDLLPERFRPKNSVLVPINIINNSIEEIGKILFETNGTITITRIISPNFTGVNLSAFASLSVSWVGNT